MGILQCKVTMICLLGGSSWSNKHHCWSNLNECQPCQLYLFDQSLSVELEFSLSFCRCLCLFVLFILYIFISWIQSSKPCWVHIHSRQAELSAGLMWLCVCLYLQWNFSHTQLRHKSLEKLLHYWTGENRHIFSQVNYTNLIHHKKVFFSVLFS